VKVFLCGTYSDLVDERQAVLAKIDELKLQHESMDYALPLVRKCQSSHRG
jgi:hypothetical protein